MKYYFLRCAALLFVVGALLCNDAQAQKRYKYKKSGKGRSKAYSKFRGSKAFASRARKFSYAGVNLNAFNYYGDLTKRSGRFKSDISFTRPGFGFHAGYQFRTHFALRAEFNYGRLTSTDEKAEGLGLKPRNLSFRNDIKELSVGISANLFEIISANRRPPFNPYAYASIAVFHHEPRAQLSTGEWEKLRPLGTEGQFISGSGVGKYSPIQLAIPFGIGVRMRLPNNLNLSFEVGGRQLFTDYIDDVSSEKYPDRALLAATENGDKAVAFFDRSSGQSYSQNDEIRGNPKQNDFYIVTQFKLSYIFGATGIGRGKFR